MAKPGPKPRIEPSDVLDVFEAREDSAEPLTAPELADALSCSRRTALNRLHDLDGELSSKQVGGRSRVWWVPLVDSDSAGSDSSVAASTSEREDRPPELEESPVIDERAANKTTDPDGLDLPGTGVTSASRHDALNAVCLTIEDKGSAKTSELKRVAWETDSETYSDANSLWKNCIYPALVKLAQFESQGHSGQWVFLDS